ncbi:MAG: hypothetical protein F6K63_33140 [Moorea sp. SIO1G6]|uniref:hypothetical protein n=1 Tax=Moorena sp. SIO1G6 TaxID=2607840 RepID=UPI0013BFE785|nr:hypothetical protein [Moorena sp. SIO1G6]NET68983.1 hypothetical protein [Moorena sp. SIO1G6]
MVEVRAAFLKSDYLDNTMEFTIKNHTFCTYHIESIEYADHIHYLDSGESPDVSYLRAEEFTFNLQNSITITFTLDDWCDAGYYDHILYDIIDPG